MSLGGRLLRAAGRRIVREVAKGLGGAARKQDPAREELESYLKDASAGAGRRPQASPQAKPTASPPPPPPKHPYEGEYRLLGAPVGSDLETVRHHWRAKVREHHPDRFPANSDEQRRAADRLRAVNEAYHRLRDSLSSGK